MVILTRVLFFFQTSSLGSTDPTWVQEFSESISIPPNNNFPKPSKQSKKNSATPKLHIIFPTAKSVRSGSRLKVGANMVCLSSKNWNNPKFPRTLMFGTEWAANHQPRSNLIMHSKVILGVDDQGIHRWAYAGSHNFTQAAWGKLQKAGAQLHIKNYELGVVFINSDNSTPCWASSIPFSYPPPPFTSTDEPWLLFE